MHIKIIIKVFSFDYQDMLSLDTNLVVHHLTLRENAKLVKQKQHRTMA